MSQLYGRYIVMSIDAYNCSRFDYASYIENSNWAHSFHTNLACLYIHMMIKQRLSEVLYIDLMELAVT